MYRAKTDTEPNSLHGRPAGRQLRLRRPDLIAKAAQSMHAFDLVSKERVYSLRPACHSCRILGPQTPVGGRRAPGSTCWLREAWESTPEPIHHRRPLCLVGAGHPRCSRPARSRRVQLVPSLAAEGAARPRVTGLGRSLDHSFASASAALRAFTAFVSSLSALSR